MADSIDIQRKQTRRLVAEALGFHPAQPRAYTSQQRVAGRETDIVVLPVDISAWTQLVDATPASTTFGKSFFMPGIDVPDDPNHPIR